MRVGQTLSFSDFTVRGAVEWNTRTFPGDTTLRDTTLSLDVGYNVSKLLQLKVGGSKSLATDFSPVWSLFGQIGVSTSIGLVAKFRYWRISFEKAGAHVLNPTLIYYLGPFFFDLRYYHGIEDNGDRRNSATLRAGYLFDADTQVYAGGGLGDASDFLEPRESNTQSHYLIMGGAKYGVTARYSVGLDVVHRSEKTKLSEYDETQFLLTQEFEW